MGNYWLISYDIADPKRLRRVERLCRNAGSRLQESVFVCELTDEELRALQRRLAALIDLAADSIRYGPICGRDAQAAAAQGIQGSLTPPSGWIV